MTSTAKKSFSLFEKVFYYATDGGAVDKYQTLGKAAKSSTGWSSLTRQQDYFTGTND